MKSPGVKTEKRSAGPSPRSASSARSPRQPVQPAVPLSEIPLKAERREVQQFWGEYFSTHQPPAAEVQQLILQLHDGKHYEHVIAAIESALIEGQSQPWMYRVLALSMRIAGRPEDQIERVFLSEIDFSAADVPNMLMSAAYLTRLGGEQQALHLYRQTSRLAPTRPEPYVLGLRLARKLNDHDAVGWAASGILTYAWTKDYAKLHQEAESAVEESRRKLIREGRDEAAASLAEALAQARQRDLVIRLTWAGKGDLDLIVEEPPGTVCSFDLPQSPGGGVRVHDGYGPVQSNCYEHYVCAFGMPGDYRIRIRHAAGDIVGKRAQLTVIRYQGTSKEDVRRFTVSLDDRDKTIRLTLSEGRRTELTKTHPREMSAMPRRRRGLLQEIGALDAGARLAQRQFGASRRLAQQKQNLQFNSQGVGYQPIISVLSEGVNMSAMAVISGDRRYVRLSVVPSFSTITGVNTFSFINSGNPGGAGGGTAGGGAGTAAGN